jgi:hypothetical protein
MITVTFEQKTETETKTVKLEDFIKFLNETTYSYDLANFAALTQDGPYRTFSAEIGRKFIKIVVANGTHKSRSVYCFLDMDGNIYKAATWKAPAKHVRGTVFDDSYSWGKGLGMYGASYLK